MENRGEILSEGWREGGEGTLMGYVAGIGGANMDICGRSDAAVRMRDSNPGTLRMSPGGVCRNICENLARLETDVRLVTVLGDDMHGRALLDACQRAGIDMSGARVLRGERSSVYICMMDEDGDMLLAMSDMHIIKRLDERLVDDSRELLCGAELVVCDGNLSAATVRRLCQVCGRPLYLDPVSTAWARELRPHAGAFDTVKPNVLELSALTGMPVGSRREILAACDALHARGVRRVFVSQGAKGMLYSGPEGVIEGTGRPAAAVNATGAGDAAMAGIIWATSKGLDARQTLYAAMAAGILAVRSQDTVSRELSPQAIQKTIKEYLL